MTTTETATPRCVENGVSTTPTGRALAAACAERKTWHSCPLALPRASREATPMATVPFDPALTTLEVPLIGELQGTR